MNDYTVMLLATQRTSAYEREADRDRLAAQTRRSAGGADGRLTASARGLAIRDILRRLSLRPL